MDEKKLKRIAKKISKCLALTASDNVEEAASAKRQAEALMNKYNLTRGDAVASQVHTQQIKTAGKYKPPVYLVYLADIIASSFGCESIYCSGGGWSDSYVEFLGVGIKPELAGYTFDVLSRSIKKDRTEYLSTLWRYKRSNKVRLANIFCEHWVFQVSRQVHAFSGSAAEKEAISAYRDRAFGNRIETDKRQVTQKKSANDRGAILAAKSAANDISLRQPIHSKKNTILSLNRD